MVQKIFDLNHSISDLLRIFKDEPYVFLLESSLVNKQRGRYSMMGFDPFYVFSQKGISHLEDLKQKFYQFNKTTPIKELPFTSGIVGYIGYDHGLYQENIGRRSLDDLNLPDCFFGFYDTSIIIDHIAGKLIITSSGLPEKNLHLKEIRAKNRLKKVIQKLSLLEQNTRGINVFEQRGSFDSQLISNFTKEQYLRAVKKALRYIREGDIYQVNLSQRFCFSSGETIDAFLLYQILSQVSPSSFGAYFDAEDFHIISSSPERFLHVRDGIVHTRPMKGTRPRGQRRADDKHYKKELVESAKDKAELLMITDLERNDLGRVCQYGSVHVREMRAIEEYKTVYQATSTVEGILQKDKDCFDLLTACFPGGSITGCPKIRSMQIIEELEPTRRGIYTGTLGYVDFNGNMDFNILIRTLLAKENKAYFQVGGGIVADSTPEGEYEETLIKAKAMKEALLRSEEIILKDTAAAQDALVTA
jgi:para-aminobenzoate synthetase component 1